MNGPINSGLRPFEYQAGNWSAEAMARDAEGFRRIESDFRALEAQDAVGLSDLCRFIGLGVFRVLRVVRDVDQSDKAALRGALVAVFPEDADALATALVRDLTEAGTHGKHLPGTEVYSKSHGVGTITAVYLWSHPLRPDWRYAVRFGDRLVDTSANEVETALEVAVRRERQALRASGDAVYAQAAE